MKIKFLTQSKKVVAATTRGLVKPTNEDRIGVKVFKHSTKACICDGHWGGKTAEIATKKCLTSKSFPNNKNAAVKLVQSIEKEIFKKFGKRNIDEKRDFTPETSLLAVELNKQNDLKILSYGDCRLMVTRGNKIIYRHPKKKTWLGVFSFLGLRGRVSSRNATIFKKIKCQTKDLIWLFTDGVDECHYEQSTIPLGWLAKTGSREKNLKIIIGEVLNRVEKFGAEDNASIAIIKC